MIIGLISVIYEWNILERDENQQSINQSISKARLLVLQYFDFSLEQLLQGRGDTCTHGSLTSMLDWSENVYHIAT